MCKSMRQRVTLLAVTVFLVVIAATGLAQSEELTQPVALPGNYVIFVPEDWTVDEEEGIFQVSNEVIVIEILAPEAAQAVVGTGGEVDLVDLLVALFVPPEATDFDPDQVWLDEWDGRAVAGLNFEQQKRNTLYEGVQIVIDLGDGHFGALRARVEAGDFEDNEALIMAIASSFDFLGDQCTVRSAEGVNVSVRVGPGAHRGVLQFMAADQDFVVLGQMEDDDGDLWWKLDPGEVAPTSGANEVWVSDAEVVTDGACAIIGEAQAPPVIFAAPPPPPPSDEGESSGESGGDDSPPSAGGGITTSGTWTVLIQATNFCNNINYYLSDGETFSANITVTEEAIYGDIGYYAWTPSGLYVGTTVLTLEGEGQVPATVTLRVESETRITGMIAFTVGNCQYSHLVTITRN